MPLNICQKGTTKQIVIFFPHPLDTKFSHVHNSTPDHIHTYDAESGALSVVVSLMGKDIFSIMRHQVKAVIAEIRSRSECGKMFLTKFEYVFVYSFCYETVVYVLEYTGSGFLARFLCYIYTHLPHTALVARDRLLVIKQ